MYRCKDTLIKIIRMHVPQCRIYLFGSRARNTHQEGADVDLALDNGAPLDSEVQNKIRSDIEESDIHLCADIVDVHRVDQPFLENIKKEWIEWIV
ncbi:MAG: polymerase beta domain protein region protein [candidate division TM6 bacterium GW2011_GWE2_41_16]|nr:MAG: polymerase beta domain protein region protein [candidate division TM6 bacterium GW2011_GWE2_41_16]